jgi:hypothetical protein
MRSHIFRFIGTTASCPYGKCHFSWFMESGLCQLGHCLELLACFVLGWVTIKQHQLVLCSWRITNEHNMCNMYFWLVVSKQRLNPCLLCIKYWANIFLNMLNSECMSFYPLRFPPSLLKMAWKWAGSEHGSELLCLKNPPQVGIKSSLDRDDRAIVLPWLLSHGIVGSTYSQPGQSPRFGMVFLHYFPARG